MYPLPTQEKILEVELISYSVKNCLEVKNIAHLLTQKRAEEKLEKIKVEKRRS